MRWRAGSSCRAGRRDAAHPEGSARGSVQPPYSRSPPRKLSRCRLHRNRTECRVMKRATVCLIGSLIASSALAVACGTDVAPDSTGQPQPKTSASASASGSTEPAASTAPSATESATPEPSASTGNSATPTTGSSAPEPDSSAKPKKEYNCGGKGQKACPMQGWMKGVMAGAMSSGDNDKIANALNTIASKPVAGFGQWSAIASEGAAKAKAGDIEGA